MFRKILISIILVGVVFAATIRTLPPAALQADVPANEFSAGRAVEAILAIAQSPRLVGSPAYEKAAEYVFAQLTALGLKPETQKTTLDGVEVENILGRLEGSSTSEAILLMAHLDSVPVTPGAMDDASGVATVLETVRALQAGPKVGNTIIVLITGPEENCCYGAKAFATKHPWARNVRLVINVDAGGVSGPSILAATGPDEGWLIRELAGVLPDPVASSAIEALGSPATDYTLELRKDGFSGIDFNLSWTKRIHTPLDNVDHINPASIQHQGEHMLAVARRFGNLSLDFPNETRPIYFDILGITIVYYPVTWAIPVLLGLSLVMGAVLILGFKRKYLTTRGIGYGALSLVLSILTVPLLLALVQWAILRPLLAAQPASNLSEGLIGDSLLSNSIRWGSAVLTLVSTVLWYGLFNKVKRVGWNDLVVGAYLFLYIGAFGTSLALPALSYILVWPLLFGAIVAMVRFAWIALKMHEPGWLTLLGSGITAVIAIVLFVPGILIAMLSIDIRMIYLVPVFVAALAGFMVAPLGMLVTGTKLSQ